MTQKNNRLYSARLATQEEQFSDQQVQDAYSALSKAFQIEIRHVRQEPKSRPSMAISCPQDVYNLLRDSASLDREIFYCLHLSTRHEVLSLEEVFKGTLNASLVHPRELYKAAILRSAAAIIVAHNHPSGDPSPSKDDLDLTTRLKSAGEIIGIPVLDHVIIGHDGYYSLREKGGF